VDPLEQIDELILETRALDARAAVVQGERRLTVDAGEVDELVDDYNRWHARALALLPPEQHAEFEDLYEGGTFIKRIKSFLASPGEISAVFDPANENGLLPYWQHPYESAFHSSIMDQRQALAMARQRIEAAQDAADVVLVERLGRGLPRLVNSLGTRGRGRAPLAVADEYDVQFLLEGLLRALFDDVRPEDPSPTRAGASTRVDFVLKEEQIIVEAKMTRQGLGERQLGEQLIEDIERYRSHPDCRTLVAIVFDPARRIQNPKGLETDLRRDDAEMRVRVVISS
jgi:hypothetical protein